MPPFDLGMVVHERYRILRPIGKGGMGAVYEAFDLRLHATVALKRLIAEGPDVDRAFEQEAQLLASLRHGGLPAVTDYFTEGESQFLVMQYVEGEDLEHVRKRRGGRCDERDVLAWGVEVLNTLSFLHQHAPPIVHRDVKPANLKLTPRGEIVLLDFGLAKRGPSDTRVDAEGHSIYGFTANYAPPEQQQGRRTDARSDLYALGATLYHLVTGVVPASATARSAAAAGHLPDPLVPARQVNPEVSAELSRILAQALQLNSELRFQTAEDMREALAALRDLSKETPRGTEVRGARRIDAAMPSQAEINRPIDLIVQVRFHSSPRLGLEDWPSRRRPEAIEQGSEAFDIDYPLDARTRRRLPARLRVRIVAPDFTIDGASESLIEVPPETYSTRLTFLLTPRRLGLCRVHVEVYAADALHLGTVPIEADTVAALAPNPVWRVAHLVLGMLTRERLPRAPELYGNDEAAVSETTRLAFDAGLRMAAETEREEREARERARTQVAAAERDGSLTHARAGRIPKWMVFGAPFLVLLIAVVFIPRIMYRTGPMSSVPDVVPVATTIPPVPAPAPQTPPTPDATETRARTAEELLKEVQRQRETKTPAVRPTKSATATPPAGRAATTQPSPAPPVTPGDVIAGGGRGRPIPPPGGTAATPPAANIAPKFEPPLAGAASVSHPNVVVVLATAERRGEVVRLTLQFRNGGTEPVRIGLDHGLIRLVSEAGESYTVVAHSGGTEPSVLPSRSEWRHWLEFRVPESVRGAVTLTLANLPTEPDGIGFPALTFRLPAQ